MATDETDAADLDGGWSSSDDDDDDLDDEKINYPTTTNKNGHKLMGAHLASASDILAITSKSASPSQPTDSTAKTNENLKAGHSASNLADSVGRFASYYENNASPVGRQSSRARRGSRSRDRTPSYSRSTSYDELKFDYNSKHFKPQAFATKKVSESTVGDLVSFTDDLRKEVKQLDSEMQMMVYDNYSKFIDATDTIRKMKTDVEKMEGEMNNLSDKMSLIANKATSLEESFLPNRSEVEKLVHLSKLLKKLDFLFSLPVRLKQSIKLKNYSQAVSNFQMATTILQRYDNIKSFSDINIESKAIIGDLQQTLKDQIMQSSIAAQKQLDYAKLLLDLDEPAELLWYDIFETRKKSLLSTLHKLKMDESVLKYYGEYTESDNENGDFNNNDNSGASSSDENKNNDENDENNHQRLKPKINSNNNNNDNNNNGNDSMMITPFKGRYGRITEYLNKEFLTYFNSFVEKYRNVFIIPLQKTHVSEKRKIENKHKKESKIYSRNSRNEITIVTNSAVNDRNGILSAADQTTLEKSEAALTSFTREVIVDEYFTVIKECLQKENNIEKLAKELECFYDGIDAPSRQIPKASLKDRATEVIEHCIRTATEREFLKTRGKQIDFMLEYLNESVDLNDLTCDRVVEHVNKCVTKLKHFCIDCLDVLKPLTTSQSMLIPVLDLNFDHQLWEYTKGMFNDLVTLFVPIEYRLQTSIKQTPIFDPLSENLIDLQINLSTIENVKLLILGKIFNGISKNIISSCANHFCTELLSDKKMKTIFMSQIKLLQLNCTECAQGFRLMFAQRYCDILFEKFYVHMRKTLQQNRAKIHGNEMETNKDKDNGKQEEEKEEKKNGNGNDNELFEQISNVFENSLNDVCKVYSVISSGKQPFKEKSDASYSQSQLNSWSKREDIERFFADRAPTFDVVEDSAGSIVYTMYKVYFKYWSEMIQLERIDPDYLELTLADVDRFRYTIPKLIQSQQYSVLETLLGEVESASKQRCIKVEPIQEDNNDNNSNNNNNNNDEDDMVDVD